MAAPRGVRVASASTTLPTGKQPEPVTLYYGAGTQIVASGRATLVAGTVTVANTNTKTASNILLTVQSLGTVVAPTPVAVTSRVNNTSFTITSSGGTDTSVIAWAILA